MAHSHESRWTPFPWRVFLASLLVCSGGSFHLGYQQTILNPSKQVFRQFLNQSHYQHYGYFLNSNQYRLLWTLIISSSAIGGLFGSLPLVKLSEKFGRRKTFYFSTTFIILGLICQSVSKMAFSYELLCVGRIVTGFGTGLSLPLEGMYLSEISPISLRGFFSSMVGIWIQLGYLLGASIGLGDVLGTEMNWPLMFIIEIPLVLILMIALAFLHESPRYLYSRGFYEECRRSLNFFNHQNVTVILKELQKEKSAQSDRLALSELWRRPYLRRALLLCSLIVLVRGLSGMSYVQYFSTHILAGLGMPTRTAQYASVIIFVIAFLAACLGSVLIEKAGRRPLLIWTTFILIAINLSLMAFSIVYSSHAVSWAGYASVAACAVISFAVGVGPGILRGAVTPEMVPQISRSHVSLIVSLVQKSGALIAILAFYPLQGLVHDYVFMFYVIPLCIFLVVFIPWFPETKNKTVLENMKALGYVPPRNINVATLR